MAAQDSSSRGADSIDALVISVLERLTAGDVDALEQLCAANPQAAETVRARVAALSEMNLLPSDAAAMAFPERLGDFRLLRRLGGGGMGVVYEAVQESLGRTVALKLIRPEHLYFERSRERFQRETEAVARLAHPGIVSIYTVGEAQGTPYFAMEMIRGATLAQALEQVAGLAPESLVGADLRAAAFALAPDDASTVQERVAELFEGSWADTCTRVILRMTEALAHAHGRGVLHRDIKPSNIAVTPDGRATLLDFGLAGLESELRLTVSGAAIGSVLYMAPEQIAGRSHEIDARTDVYALGVTLYELLALQTPFAGADSEQTRAAILDGQPQPIRVRHRGVPRDLEIVCLKAMERERSRRYASMEAFGDDLRNVLEHRAIQARPPSAVYRARRWMVRYPATTTAVVLGSCLVTLLPTALYVQQRASSKTLERALDDAKQAHALAAEEGRRATEKAHEAQHAASLLVGLFAASDPYTTGKRDVTARDILDNHVQRVDAELSGQPELQAQLFERMGESYTNLELYTQALWPLERALELRRELHGDDDVRTARAMVLKASALRLGGQPGATELLRVANDVLARDAGTDVKALINARTLLAACLLDAGEAEEPLELLAQARENLSALDDDSRDQHWLVLTMHAVAYNRLGRPQEAELAAREALELASISDPRAVPWQAAALDSLALALLNQRKFEEADTAYATLLPLARSFYGEDSATLAQMELGGAVVRLALGRPDGVRETIARAFAIQRTALGIESSSTLSALTQLADLAQLDGRVPESLAVLRESVDELESRVGAADPRCVRLRHRIGLLYLQQREFESARAAFAQGLENLGDQDAELLALLEADLARAHAAD